MSFFLWDCQSLFLFTKNMYFCSCKNCAFGDCWELIERGVIHFKLISSEVATSWLVLIQIVLTSSKKSIVCWKNQSLLSNKLFLPKGRAGFLLLLKFNSFVSVYL